MSATPELDEEFKARDRAARSLADHAETMGVAELSVPVVTTEGSVMRQWIVTVRLEGRIHAT